MKIMSKNLSRVGALILLGGLGVEGYYAFRFMAELFGRISLQVTAVALIASTNALLAALVIGHSIRRANREQRANHFRAEKAAAYQVCLDLWQELIRYGRGSEGLGPAPSSEELLALDRLLTIYGSPCVVKAYATLRELERKVGAQNPTARSQLIQVLMEMRKDLGSETRGFSPQEVSRLLLTDFEWVSTSSKADAYEDPQPRVSLTSKS